MWTNRRLAYSATAVALVMMASCAETARYRVLSFFLDGVPPPGVSRGPSSSLPSSGRAIDAVVASPATPRFFPHTPYRENRCEGCHDASSGQLIRAVQEGLCLSCHSLVAERRYVHGPVAVNDCTVCHHYHASPHPNLMLADSVSICLNCHDRADLSTGAHHASMERSCAECHDPHGGENRFFVKREAP
jgi:predicted CXXCH cytochrome family protein